MADAPTPAPAEEIDPFAAAFDDAVKPDTPPAKPAKAAAPDPAPAAPTEAPKVAGQDAIEAPTADAGLDLSAVAEERPVAPTHKEDGSAFTPEEVRAEQARLDKEFDEAKAAKVEADKKPAAALEPVTDDDLVKRLGALLGKQPTPAAPETTRAPAAPAVPAMTAEEQTFMASFEKDWPDMKRAQDIMMRVALQHVTQHIFSQVTGRYDPLFDQIGSVTTSQAQTDLQRAIPDYDAVRDKVIAWVGTQPKLLKSAYDRVVEEGTVDEIKEMVDIWRAQTGAPAAPAARAAPAAAAAPPTPAAPAAPPKTPTEAAKRVVAGLAPVATKRSTPTAGIAKEDFDGAFAEAAKEIA